MLWNNVLSPLTVLQNTAYVTVLLSLVPFRGSNAAAYTGMLGASLVAAPVVLLYVLIQRQIVGTFATSGTKG